VGLCVLVPGPEVLGPRKRKFTTSAKPARFNLRSDHMPSLEEIRAEKVQIRLEKIALDAQILKALKASELLSEQLLQLRIEQSMKITTAPGVTSMDAYLGISGDGDGDGDGDFAPLKPSEHSATQAIGRWFTGTVKKLRQQLHIT